MSTKINRPSVKSLYFGAHDIKPRDFDWSEGYAEKWEFFEARTRDGDDTPKDKDADLKIATNFDGSERYTFEGPMMNYYYPLPTYDGDPREDCKKLVDLPLCIVEFLEEDRDGRYALALTGGGMDLSWEICEAFMLLGYVPPAHFAADLPQMAGRGTSARDRWIIVGCRRSLQAIKYNAGRALRRLRENFKAEAGK